MNNKFYGVYPLFTSFFICFYFIQISSMDERSIPEESPLWRQLRGHEARAGNPGQKKQPGESNSDQKNSSKKNEDCPLHALAFDGNDQKIIYHLEKHKYDVDTLDNHGRTPLYWAVLGKKIGIIKLLLDRGADIKLIFPDAQRLLEKPAYSEVRSLLELAQKGQLDRQNFEDFASSFVSKSSLLFKLAKKGNHQEILKYVTNDNVDIEDNSGKTPLYYAVLHRNFITARVLLEHGANFDKIKNLPKIGFSNLQEYKNSVLFKLVKRIEPEELKYYVTQENVNIQDSNGKTPLYYAMLNYVRLVQLPDADENRFKNQQALETVEILLAHGANHELVFNNCKDIKSIEFENLTPKQQKNFKKLNDLLDSPAKLHRENLDKQVDPVSSLNAAIETNDPAVVERYFNEVEWLQDDITGIISTSLLHAIQILEPDDEVRNFRINGQSDYTRELYVQNLVQIINFLFTKKPELRSYRNRGKNLLHLAVRKTRTSPEIIQCLIQNGVSDDAADDRGQTPFDFLINVGGAKLRSIEILMQYKSDNFLRIYTTANGQNLLHKAVEWNLPSAKIQEWANRFGNIILIPDNNGITPFDLAFNQRNLQALVVFGQNVSADFLRNYRNNGKNLIHFAVEWGLDSQTLRTIIRLCGRNAIEDLDNDGLTPLARAVERRNIEAIRILREFKANENIKLNINGQRKKLHDLACENNVQGQFPSIFRRNLISGLGIILGGSLSAFLIINRLAKDYNNRNSYV